MRFEGRVRLPLRALDGNNNGSVAVCLEGRLQRLLEFATRNKLVLFNQILELVYTPRAH